MLFFFSSKLIRIILNYFLLLSPLELIVGFVETVYSVLEAVGTVTVLVEIKAGTVGDGEPVKLKFTTRDKTASST